MKPSNGISANKGEQLCQIIWKSKQKYRTNDLDKSRRTDAHTHMHQSAIVTTTSRLQQAGLRNNTNYSKPLTHVTQNQKLPCSPAMTKASSRTNVSLHTSLCDPQEAAYIHTSYHDDVEIYLQVCDTMIFSEKNNRTLSL